MLKCEVYFDLKKALHRISLSAYGLEMMLNTQDENCNSFRLRPARVMERMTVRIRLHYWRIHGGAQEPNQTAPEEQKGEHPGGVS